MTAAPDPRHSRLARFRAVYDTNYHRVLGYALRRTASREDAEDVVAETFLTAWRRLEEVPRGSGARPWLYGVARNALANQHRGERRRGRLSGRLHAEPTLAAWHWADTNDGLASVAAAFARLREDDRELLALAVWEELDPGEIATVLGCSRNAARIRLHRARRRLAHELRRHGRRRASLVADLRRDEAGNEEGNPMSTSNQLDDLVARLQPVRDEDLAGGSEVAECTRRSSSESWPTSTAMSRSSKAPLDRRPRHGRRWLIAAVAAARSRVVALLAIDVGPSPETVTPAAAALREAADVARAQDGIPLGRYLYVRSVNASLTMGYLPSPTPRPCSTAATFSFRTFASSGSATSPVTPGCASAEWATSNS